MDTKSLFNNPEDSDVKILLTAGQINAHRVILKYHSGVFKTMLNSAYNESRGEIQFKSHEDAVVIAALRFIYGLGLEVADANMWLHMMYFANFIDAPGLKVALIAAMPNDINICDVIRAASELCDNKLMSAANKLIRRHYPLKSEEIISDLRKIDAGVYLTLRGCWIDDKFDLFTIFSIDCRVCAEEDLIAVLNTIDFSQFEPAQLATCAQQTAEIPHLAHMFECMSMQRRRRACKSGRGRGKNLNNK